MDKVFSGGGLSSLLPEEISALVETRGEKPFRAGQLFGWLHQKQVASFDEMTNLPAALRQSLARDWPLEMPAVARQQTAADGTVKALLTLHDGHCVEAVLMRYHHGNSLCISTQVGCRMGCRFCASTQGGKLRDLTAGEMAGQVYAMQAAAGVRVDHLVLMGIGEPLDNYDNVLRFLRIITHEKGQNLSWRNISLSTCGVVPRIRQLAGEHLGLTLSVSLHAATDEKRSALMPVNQTWPLEELLAACREYQQATGRRISYEYALVAGQNDGEEDAAALAGLLRGMGAHINLIPVNPVDGSPYTASHRAAVEAFRASLVKKGLNATVRRRLGSDISAACGQLRAEHAQDIPKAQTQKSCKVDL